MRPSYDMVRLNVLAGRISAMADTAGWLNVKARGAAGDGTTDDGPAIQAVLDSAVYGDTVYLPPGIYRINQGLSITKPITLRGSGFGAGSGSILQVGSSVASTVDTITVTPDGNWEYLVFEDFGILPQSGTPGRDGIRFDVSASGTSCSKVTVSRVFIRAPAGRAINVNSPNVDHDAFFLSQILDSQLEGGIYLNGAGDSINIHRNTIRTTWNAVTAGQGPGVEAKILSAYDAGLGDSSQLSIAFNNIVCHGGAVRVKSGVRTKILYNNMEGLSGTSQVDVLSGLVWLEGDANHILQNCEVSGNYVGVNHAQNHGIRVDYAYHTRIEGNTITPGGGVWTNYPTTPATYDTNWRGISMSANSLYTFVGRNTFDYNDWVGYEWRTVGAAGQAEIYQVPNTANFTLTGSGDIGTKSYSVQDASVWNLDIQATSSPTFTLSDPNQAGSLRINPISPGYRLIITFKNASGGALGTITFGGAYKVATGSTWDSSDDSTVALARPANGKSRTIECVFDGTYWVEVSRTPYDVPN